MELTKEQARIRKNCLVKGHLWFGYDELKLILKKGYDYYIEDRNMVYIFKKLSKTEQNKLIVKNI